jgi:hypothetical protein
MAGIRERDKRAAKFRDSTACGNLVPRLFSVRNMFFLERSNPYWPSLILAVAWFALAMFELIAIEDVQHAGEGRVVCLHYIPNGPGSVCKNRHDEARIFVT